MEKFYHIHPSNVTPEFLKRNDEMNVVWSRDDYLMGSPILKYSNPQMYEFLEHVYTVKEAAKKSGMKFEN